MPLFIRILICSVFDHTPGFIGVLGDGFVCSRCGSLIAVVNGTQFKVQ